MKLLLDQNLSPQLCDRLRDIWTDVVHVRAVGLAAADDSAVWAYARQYGFTIVSKDSDFSGRSSLFGAPPKVIWLALGNCSTSEIERRLRGHHQEIETFGTEPNATLLVIEPGPGCRHDIGARQSGCQHDVHRVEHGRGPRP